MKEIRVEVPDSQIDVLLGLLNAHKMTYSQFDLVGDNQLFILKVKENQTNELMHELRSRGVGEIFGQISIYDLNLFISATPDKSDIETSAAANVEEILASIEDSAVLSSGYISLVILSSILAAFGLLSNSVVIIIGSMIVAPLLGPVALTSLGVLLPGKGLFLKGLMAEVVGISLTVLIGFLIGLLMDPIEVTQEMIDRGSEANSLYNIVFALISGLAAGLIISKGQSLSMVGVAIAASLAPPAANIGLFLSLSDYENALFTILLLVINILAINASCSFMFALFKLSSTAGISKRQARVVRRNLLILIIMVLSAFILLSILYSNLSNII